MRLARFIQLIIFLIILSTRVQAETVTVGVIVPLTGPAATWGTEIRNAALLSKESADLGSGREFRLIFEDDAFQPKQTVTGFNKLLALEKIHFLVTFGGSPSGAVAPLADTHKIPMFAITGAESVAATRHFVLRHWVSVQNQASTIVDQLKKSNLSRVAVVITENEPPRNFLNVFKRLADTEQIEVVYDQSVLPEDRDFRTLSSKLSQLELDAIVTALLPGHLGTFAKQARSAGLDVPLFGFSGSESKGELKVGGAALEGLTYAISEPTPEFRSAYFKAYQKQPELAAANAYDIIQLIGSAVRESCCDPIEMNAYLHELKEFSGALGRYRLESNNAFDVPAVAKIVRNGLFQLKNSG